MKLRLSDIATAVEGELTGGDLEVRAVGIDTRTLEAGALYIAIKGHQFDGHDFIDKAEQAGAGALLLQQFVESRLPQIRVKDTRLALAMLAGFWRQQLSVKLVGVTGSNGKTTVKEMIAAIFATQGDTLATRGNLNNDIGVPLTLLALEERHRYAVIEMGANHPGEIAYTSHYAQADVSVITNVSAAHIEGFGDVHGVAATKGEIIHSLSLQGTAVLNRDDVFYSEWLRLADGRQTVSFGFDAAADVRAENIHTTLTAQGFISEFDLTTAGVEQGIKLQLAGKHNVKNALAAAAVAMQFGIDLQDIKRGLENVQAVTGRMQVLQGRSGNIVIDDTYNANPASLEAALASLTDCGRPIWVALGAFGELGPQSPALHSEMGQLLKAMSVERLFATGEMARHTVEAFGDGAEFFAQQEQLIAALSSDVGGPQIILVKGSRAQKMEKVAAAMVNNFRAA